jgi:hypothetical protein
MSAEEIENLVDEAAGGAPDLDYAQFMRLLRIESGGEQRASTSSG